MDCNSGNVVEEVEAEEEEQVEVLGNGDDMVIPMIILLLAVIWQMSFYSNSCSC